MHDYFYYFKTDLFSVFVIGGEAKKNPTSMPGNYVF